MPWLRSAWGGWITYGFGGTNPNFPRKALEFKVHKTEGYLGEKATIHMVLPEEGTLFEQGGTAAWTYVTDDGYQLEWNRISIFQDPPTPGNRDVVVDLRSLLFPYDERKFSGGCPGFGLKLY